VAARNFSQTSSSTINPIAVCIVSRERWSLDASGSFTREH
jgi:hypothetical protein